MLNSFQKKHKYGYQLQFNALTRYVYLKFLFERYCSLIRLLQLMDFLVADKNYPNK